MRTATLVIVAYGLCVIVGAVWRLVAVGRGARCPISAR